MDLYLLSFCGHGVFASGCLRGRTGAGLVVFIVRFCLCYGRTLDMWNHCFLIDVAGWFVQVECSLLSWAHGWPGWL